MDQRSFNIKYLMSKGVSRYVSHVWTANRNYNLVLAIFRWVCISFGYFISYLTYSDNTVPFQAVLSVTRNSVIVSSHHSYEGSNDGLL